MKGTTKFNFPFWQAFIIKDLKSKSFAKIGLSFEILYSPSQSPKFFSVSFDLLSELRESILTDTFFDINFIVDFIISLCNSLFLSWSKTS